MLTPPGPHEQAITALQEHFHAQREAFMANPMPSAEQRIAWLDSLKAALLSDQDALVRCISEDFGNRSADETLLAEMLPTVQGLSLIHI